VRRPCGLQGQDATSGNQNKRLGRCSLSPEITGYWGEKYILSSPNVSSPEATEPRLLCWRRFRSVGSFESYHRGLFPNIGFGGQLNLKHYASRANKCPSLPRFGDRLTPLVTCHENFWGGITSRPVVRLWPGQTRRTRQDETMQISNVTEVVTRRKK